MYKHLALAIICNLFRVKDVEEWSVERDASISVVFIDSCNLLETRKIVKPSLYVCWNVLTFNEDSNVFLLNSGFSKYHTVKHFS